MIKASSTTLLVDNKNLKFFKKQSIIAQCKALNERISEWAYFLNLDKRFQTNSHFCTPKKGVFVDKSSNKCLFYAKSYQVLKEILFIWQKHNLWGMGPKNNFWANWAQKTQQVIRVACVVVICLKPVLCRNTYLCVQKMKASEKWFPYQKHDKWCIFLFFTMKIHLES